MTKSTLLNIAITLSKIVKVVFVLLFISLTVIFVHLQIDRNFYSSKNITINTNSENYSFAAKWKVNTDEDYNKIFTIKNIKTSSIYLMYFKYIGMLIALTLCIKEFQKVMESVRAAKTFGEGNVVSFRRIGKYILIYGILASYVSMSFENGGFRGINLPFTALFLMLFAFIMAEIFKEGNLLKEENDLTV